MPGTISEGDLLAALNRLATDLGRPPTREEMESQGQYSATPYYRQFGTWTAALKAADLEPQHRQDIPEAELLTSLCNLAAKLGHPPRSQDMASQGPFSPSTYRRRFGSWAAALDQADLSPEDQSTTYRVARDELLATLHDLAENLGRPPTQTDMEKHGSHSIDIYHDRFGSWNAALAETGLQLD